MVVRQTLTQTMKILARPTQTKQKNQKKTENPDLITHPVRPVVILTIPQKNVNL